VASALFADALSAAPQNSTIAARHRAWHVTDRVPLEDAEATARLARDFGPGGTLLRTRHWRIAYDAPLDSVRFRAAMLEASWRKFHEFAALLGTEPQLIDDRLEAMVFADHSQWAAATGLAPEALKGLDGIYVGHTGRMLLYDTGTSPDSRRALAGADEKIAAIDALLAGVNAAGSGDAHRRLQDDRVALMGHRAALVDWWRQETLSTTTHEACHQIAFATGLCRSSQPLWLIEGLATLFEPAERERFLVTASNAGRLRDVREAWSDGRGADLRRIVGGETFDAAARHGDVSETALAYAEAWSLVHYLVTRRRNALAKYMQSARTGEGDEATRLAAFQAAFGPDLDALHRGWRRHVRRL